MMVVDHTILHGYTPIDPVIDWYDEQRTVQSFTHTTGGFFTVWRTYCENCRKHIRTTIRKEFNEDIVASSGSADCYCEDDPTPW